jgi:hypothetical protein
MSDIRDSLCSSPVGGGSPIGILQLLELNNVGNGVSPYSDNSIEQSLTIVVADW